MYPTPNLMHYPTLLRRRTSYGCQGTHLGNYLNPFKASDHTHICYMYYYAATRIVLTIFGLYLLYCKLKLYSGLDATGFGEKNVPAGMPEFALGLPFPLRNY